MLLAINRSVGTNIGFPDLVPTIVGPAVAVLPYLNMAMHAMSVGFSINVMLSGTPALSLASIVPVTTGDEPGMPGMNKQMGRFIVGNPIVHVNMLPGIHLTCPTSGNNMKNPLGAVLVPGITNVFYTYRSGGTDAGAEGEVESVARELSSAGRADGPPVEHRFAGDGVGVVSIRVFSSDVPARVHCALRALQGEGVSVLVFDLRDNPGGELGAFVELAGDFLPEGAEICAVVDAAGDETIYSATREMACSLPIVILVNRGTASAAELFAGCLSAHGRALVLGGPTHGKNTGYRFTTTPEGEVLRVQDGWVRLPSPSARPPLGDAVPTLRARPPLGDAVPTLLAPGEGDSDA